MSKRTLFQLTMLSALFCIGVALAASPPTASELKTDTFAVEGMTCGGCEVGVRMAVGKLDGIEQVKASYSEGTAVVTYDPAKASPKDIIAAIKKLGYEAKLVEKPKAGTR